MEEERLEREVNKETGFAIGHVRGPGAGDL